MNESKTSLFIQNNKIGLKFCNIQELYQLFLGGVGGFEFFEQMVESFFFFYSDCQFLYHFQEPLQIVELLWQNSEDDLIQGFKATFQQELVSDLVLEYNKILN
eukprot:TRINITY_DN491_c0_g1_i1.p1 TRINITY_DN491_c0_g1~~TRINITY_DN491_c0_g1_i1.p1  ORF type:complete len:103 (+),score=3.26 TRINITY_DN491_c0_g1_i1:250-558(+)